MVKNVLKKYAVIKVGGSQYRVKENDEILVSKLNDKPEVKVILFVEGDNLQIGKPILDKVEVKTKIIGEEKGQKVEVIKFKAKSRYRRRLGFRPKYTRLLIEKISSKI